MTMINLFIRVAACFMLVLSVGCNRLAVPGKSAKTPHVLVIGIDGLGAHGIGMVAWLFGFQLNKWTTGKPNEDAFYN